MNPKTRLLTGFILICLIAPPAFLLETQPAMAQNGTPSTDNCQEHAFLTFPTWYDGLQCDSEGGVVFTDLSDVWHVAGNVLDMLIQIGGLIAVGFIIYGGIRYIISQGDPDNLQSAKKIISNAIIGLVLAIMASTIVGFIAGSF